MAKMQLRRLAAASVLTLCLAACGEDDVGSDDPTECRDTEGWPSDWTSLEADVLSLVNERRSQGASCGSEGEFGPAPVLRLSPKLTCAARRHSSDMAHRDFFDHVNPDGEQPADRVRAAGYFYQRVGENIAIGQGTAAQVMAGWMQSPGHCANIMSEPFSELGVGFVSTDEDAEPGVLGRYWTQVFGRPL